MCFLVGLFAFNTGLALFHFFVEEGVFSFECLSTDVETIEELKASLLSTPSCSVKNYFFGMRITVLSFLYSGFIAILAIASLLQTRGNKIDK